jgi:ubiquitin-protein ligase
MTFPDAYPLRAPIIQFDKDIKHHNINSDGVLVADFVTPIPDESWMLIKKCCHGSEGAFRSF